MVFRGVLFDLGGVVLRSPLHAIRECELRWGLDPGFVNGVVASAGRDGAWGRHERGELDFESFATAFAAECVAAGGVVDVAALMEAIDGHAQPVPAMLKAIERLKALGYRVGALTNNWRTFGSANQTLEGRFDVFVESVVEGVNKPDPRIYEIALERLGLPAPEVIFLDDIGRNLKVAKAMGMATIKVEDPDAALDALWNALGAGHQSPKA